MVESTRVTGNNVDMVDLVDQGMEGWTPNKGKMDSTKRI